MNKSVGFSLIFVAYLTTFALCQDAPCPADYCLNQGTCTSTPKGLQCTCSPDNYGKHCESSYSCTPGECFNGGTCHYVPGKGKTCQCILGFVGGNCEYEIFSGKILHPKLPGNEVPSGYPDDMYAFNCNTQASPSNCFGVAYLSLSFSLGLEIQLVSSSGSVVANISASEMDHSYDLSSFTWENFIDNTAILHQEAHKLQYLIEDYPGEEIFSWLTPFRPESCSLSCVYGFCQSDPFYEVCLCYPGSSGDLCEESGCFHHNCGSGTCSADSLGNPTCQCPDGTFGGSCPPQDCPEDYCKNNGTCLPGGSSGFYCFCSEEFFGHFCEIEGNPCDGVFCNQGTCELFQNIIPLCACDEGWSGADCSDAVCADIKCHHGANCTDGIGCECPQGTNGLYCENVDACFSMICKNGGTCKATPWGTASCTCSPGYIGSNCEELDPCLGVVCNNGGTCESSMGSFTCLCPSPFHGQYCEEKYSSCTPNFGGPFVLFETKPTRPYIESGEDIILTFTKELDCSSISFLGLTSVPKSLCRGNVLLLKTTAYSIVDLFYLVHSIYGELAVGSIKKTIDVDPCPWKFNACNGVGKCVHEFGKTYCECIPGFTGENCEQREYQVKLGLKTCDKPNAGTFGPVYIIGSSDSEDFPPIVFNSLAQGSYIEVSQTLPSSDFLQPEGFIAYLDSSDSWCFEYLTIEMSTLPRVTVQMNTWLTPIRPRVQSAIDYCSTNPCEFGGCVSFPFSCNCPAPGIWNGELCDDGDSCNPNPCSVGNCTDLYFDYECTCPLGYIGKNCETVDPCGEESCFNGGTCVADKNGFTCMCPPGTSGSACEIATYTCDFVIMDSPSAPSSGHALIKFYGDNISTDYVNFGRFLERGVKEQRKGTNSVFVGEIKSIEVTTNNLKDALGLNSITCSVGSMPSKTFNIKGWVLNSVPSIMAFPS